jgi:hypothetical protein
LISESKLVVGLGLGADEWLGLVMIIDEDEFTIVLVIVLLFRLAIYIL